MNDIARDKLVQAALDGVPQIKDSYATTEGVCGLGALGYRPASLGNHALDVLYAMREHVLFQCPLGCAEEILSDRGIISHFNDIHDMSFLDIARKMP